MKKGGVRGVRGFYEVGSTPLNVWLVTTFSFFFSFDIWLGSIVSMIHSSLLKCWFSFGGDPSLLLLSLQVLLENRAMISDIYRMRVMVILILYLTITLTIPALWSGPSALLAHWRLPGIAVCLTILFIIKLGLLSVTGTIVLVFLLSIVGSCMIIFRELDPFSEGFSVFDVVPPFVKYYSTLVPILPSGALYGLGPRRSLPYVAMGVMIMACSLTQFMFFNPGSCLFLESNPQYLSVGFMVQTFPILFLLAADEEAKLYHVLLQLSLKDAERKSQAKTTFISRMSHEMRTPLQGLLSSASLLKETKITEDQSTFVDLINSCGGLLLSIMDKILDISRIESGRFEIAEQPFSLLDLVPSIVESVVSLASTKRLELFVHFDLSAKSYNVIADQKHVRGILINVSHTITPLIFLPL